MLSAHLGCRADYGAQHQPAGSHSQPEQPKHVDSRLLTVQTTDVLSLQTADLARLAHTGRYKDVTGRCRALQAVTGRYKDVTGRYRTLQGRYTDIHSVTRTLQGRYTALQGRYKDVTRAALR